LSFRKPEVKDVLNPWLSELQPEPTSEDPTGHRENLSSFVDRLKSGCDLDASLECYACIYTYPAQSEVNIMIDSSGHVMKIGYGIALKDETRFTTRANGGFHFSPEVGVRFGAGDVSYYLGIEYKLQKASFVSENFFGGGGTFTDNISYRRFELRTGLLF